MATFQQVAPGLPSICVEVDATTDPTLGAGSRVWTDITTLVRSLEYSSSGRVNELQRSATGTLSALVSNRGDAITNLGLHKRQWIRVRSQWLGVTYAEWQGIIEQLPRSWPAWGNDAVIQLTAAGVFKVPRLFPLDGVTRPAERNDQRVAAIAALAGLGTTSFSTDTDTADAVTAPGYSTGTDALSVMTAIEESENGLLVETRDGLLQFQGRHYRFVNSATPRATFGEAQPAEIPYNDDAAYSDDDSLVATYVAVTPLGASSPQVAQSAGYGAKHWVSSLTRSLVSSSTLLALNAAQWILARYQNPAPRIPAVTVDLAKVARLAPTLIPTLLGTNISDRFTWKRNAPTTITQDVYVEQIRESLKPGSWVMQFSLSPAVDEVAWVLGDAVFGLLGQTTVLSY